MSFNDMFRKYSLSFLAAIWTASLIAPLVYFPSSSVLVGHPWKVELAISLILSLFLAHPLFSRQYERDIDLISPAIIRWIIAPCCALIFWSALTALEAHSVLSVAHHTLVWAGYLIFLLLAIQITLDRRVFKISVIALGSVVSGISLCCIVEFVSAGVILEPFGTRYARFAEIFAALLPLFFSFTLRLNRKHFWWSAAVTAFLWLGLLLAMSRGSLFSAIAGLGVFVSLRLFSDKTTVEKRRLIFAIAGLVFVTVITQVSLSYLSEEKGGTFSRVATSSEKNLDNSLSRNIRFLFAGVGKEMFFDNYLTGVGADNFGLRFNQYRAVFSADPSNQNVAGQQEESIPERAHNEYLQIAAELGIVGVIIFLWLLSGIAKFGFDEITRNRFNRSNILSHAAIAGVVAFLISSSFSSFSFRLMQNGLVFFFLLAILLKNFVTNENRKKPTGQFFASPIKPALTAIALTACLSLAIFSGLKAASQYFVYQGEREKDFDAAQSYYETAMQLDAANASADFSFAARLLSERQYEQSAAEFQRAVRKGINDSVSYSYLISAQTLANQPQQALETSSEAVKIFPYSVFLRVRYAELLNRFGEKNQSVEQFKIAEQINKKNAGTWRLLITDGALKASQESHRNKEISDISELKPSRAVYAVIAERDLTYPEEKAKFSF